MIFAEDFENMLRDTGKEFLISDVKYVSDILAWSKEKKVDLSEPSLPIKLVTEGGSLVLFVQSEIPDEMLDNVITGLGVRWSLRDNMSNISRRINTVKKRLAYCLLKECAKTVEALGRDELLEDEWAMNRMEELGFFLE